MRGHQRADASDDSTCSLRGAPAARVISAPVGVEDQRGRRAQDAQPAHQLEVVLGVDLDVDHPGHRGGDVGQHAAGRAAGGTERGGELQQRGPLPQLVLEVGARQDRRGRGGLGGGLGAATRWVPEKRPSTIAR